MIYPWQIEHWQRLVTAHDRLPHALLVAGPAGIGKRDFAEALAARLLCDGARDTAEACGVCEPCRWRLAGSHPDLLLIVPEADQEPGLADGEAQDSSAGDGKKKARASRQIRIDQIRVLSDRLAVGSHRGGRRLIVIQPAEAMNHPTANALLKLLEEPPAATSFILVSNAPSRLLATIRSRCRRVSLGRPDSESAGHWLAAQGIPDAAADLAYWGGYPLLARACHRSPDLAEKRAAIVGRLAQGDRLDPVAVAGEWERLLDKAWTGEAAFAMAQVADGVQKWLADLIRCRSGLAPRFHLSQDDDLRRLACGVAGARLFDCYNYLLKLKPYVEHPLNPRLFIEDLLIRYVRAVATEER